MDSNLRPGPGSVHLRRCVAARPPIQPLNRCCGPDPYLVNLRVCVAVRCLQPPSPPPTSTIGFPTGIATSRLTARGGLVIVRHWYFKRYPGSVHGLVGFNVRKSQQLTDCHDCAQSSVPALSPTGKELNMDTSCATLYSAGLGAANIGPAKFLTTNAPASRRRTAEHSIPAANRTATNKCEVPYTENNILEAQIYTRFIPLSCHPFA